MQKEIWGLKRKVEELENDERARWKRGKDERNKKWREDLEKDIREKIMKLMHFCDRHNTKLEIWIL